MYLSKMAIKDFRGIRELALVFNRDINVIIAENGAFKSTVIDAIRLLYSLGEQNRDVFVHDEDFRVDNETGEVASQITISYEFRGLSDQEKGALYEYAVISADEQYAAMTLMFTRRQDRGPKFDYFTGQNPGQKANPETFEIFQHYYLGALRDSTSDLLDTRRTILGRVIKRSVDRGKTEQDYRLIMQTANEGLLSQREVRSTKDGINSNLTSIHGQVPRIDLHIEPSRLDRIVNVIKPFLPLQSQGEIQAGLSLSQNSLGFNNLIYIATVLSDIRDRVTPNEIIHFALLIEEPEAHLHPQLQLSLYNFLKKMNDPDNCQLFITTHSPTLASTVELDNMIMIDGAFAKCVGQCFKDREGEGLKQNGKEFSARDFELRKRMLERYLDVTRSQLLFARSLLMVEGISEGLLMVVFAQLKGFRMEDHDIELVQTGTSFYPFLLLFNSKNESKRLSKKVAILTDDDRFPDSKNKEYSFSKLGENDFEQLELLYSNIEEGVETSRIANLEEMRCGNDRIRVFKAYKTLEYEIALANVPARKSLIESNLLFTYLRDRRSDYFTKIDSYLESKDEDLDEAVRKKVAILLWKSVSTKAEFAQDFSSFLLDNFDRAKRDFQVPEYIAEALAYLRQG